MPELPEVEHLRRTLEPALIGRTVSRVRVVRRDVVVRPGDPCGGFARAGARPDSVRVPGSELLAGQRVGALLRHGKQLGIGGESGRAVCVHLGMSGQLLHVPAGGRVARTDHVHVVWTLDDGSRLIFRDPRRFGGVWTFATLDDLRLARWGALGPDALSVSAHDLRARLGRTARAVKAALLDQSVVAGVGNIYADEALFAAGIHPARRADTLDSRACARLARAIREILRRAVAAGGSTLRDYADARGAPGAFQRQHVVYGRGGLPCARCSTPLSSSAIAQRTSVWCPLCQGMDSPQIVPTDRAARGPRIACSSP